MTDPIFDVTTAVAVLNQTLDYAYPTITVVGEVSEFRVSKGRLVYFDVKDDNSKLRCFAVIFQLKTPLEDGMKVQITAHPRLHNLYGFSLNVVTVQPVGEGSIKKSQDLLKQKLEKEGLFSPERKRLLPFAPQRIGLVTSEQSAAYADFIKIMNARWGGVEVQVYNVAVQGEDAVEQIVSALQFFNVQADLPEVIVVIRGGGSSDDLSAFSTEPVTRAVAACRIPTLVAIGHEIDISLAELAADMRASTPSNAAELLFPDKKEMAQRLKQKRELVNQQVGSFINNKAARLGQSRLSLEHQLKFAIDNKTKQLQLARALLESAHPRTVLRRGYALVAQKNGKLVSNAKQLSVDDELMIEFKDGKVMSKVKEVY